uniref:UBX domain-containing protein n=1 Tax=Heterosigma akashiwo TaxID=2829 RepID=A0A7S4D9Z1_HETAK
MKVREGDIVTAARVDAKYLSHPLVQQGRRIKVVSPAEGYVTAYSRNNQPFLKTTSGSTFQPGQRRSSNSLPDQGSLPLQHGMSQASNEALAMYSAINGQSTAQAQVARVLKMISSTASQGFINTEEKAELKARLIQGESVQVIENTLQQKIQHAQHQQASAPLASFTAERMAQDDEYLEALRQDRLKAEQRKKAEAERQLELEKQQIEKERAERLASEYKKRIGVLRARFANETHLSSPDCKRVRIVMPSGKKVQRQFHASDTVQDLHDFVEVWFFDNQETVKDFELVTSFPRVVLDQYRQTLEQQGFGPSTILYVHDLMA